MLSTADAALLPPGGHRPDDLPRQMFRRVRASGQAPRPSSRPTKGATRRAYRSRMIVEGKAYARQRERRPRGAERD
jgi:hypothetical protein